MVEMLIQFEKRSSGGSVLRCLRSDGSVTWQCRDGHQAVFFPIHDLTHYAVEQTLGFQAGFFGLVAAGWSIEETTGRGARGPLPDETLLVEYLVGLLDLERGGAATWSAVDMNEALLTFTTTRDLSVRFQLSDADLRRVWERLQELLARWAALPTRAALELPFELPPIPS